MNAEPPPVPQTSRAWRWFGAALTVAATCYSGVAVSCVRRFEGVYRDLFPPSGPLPPSAAWLLRNDILLLVGLMVVSGLTLMALFRHRSLALALAAAGVAVVMNLTVGVWISKALIEPLIPVFQSVPQ